jgi:hypothetical protein
VAVGGLTSMRTYVRMTQYVIADAQKPWVALFVSSSLDSLAEALAAQPTPREVTLYGNDTGRERPLQPKERIVLFERLAELVPGDEEAAAELAAAYEAATGDEAAGDASR